MADSTECCPNAGVPSGTWEMRYDVQATRSGSDVELASPTSLRGQRGLSPISTTAIATGSTRTVTASAATLNSLPLPWRDTFYLPSANRAAAGPQQTAPLGLRNRAKRACARCAQTRALWILERIAVAAQVDADADAPLSAADARALVDEAFAGLNSSDRDVLDLALRQRLKQQQHCCGAEGLRQHRRCEVVACQVTVGGGGGCVVALRTLPRGCEQLDAQIGPDQQFTRAVAQADFTPCPDLHRVFEIAGQGGGSHRAGWVASDRCAELDSARPC